MAAQQKLVAQLEELAHMQMHPALLDRGVFAQLELMELELTY